MESAENPKKSRHFTLKIMIENQNYEDDFNHLSLKDLLEARDLYHVHLLHKKNVVATAVGKYRIRKMEPYPENTPKLKRVNKDSLSEVITKNRTLENSEV